MFADPNKNCRKYQCFCCGVQFNNFVEFTNHIIEKHEEGRDYVRCPLERCKACIRCVKSHFKAKHPSEKLPTKGLMKAIIWKDVLPNGKTKVKKRGFREGWHQSTKMGKSFYHRSGYEKKVFELLDSWNDVLAYDVEPFKIPYVHEGSIHQYTPDIFIAFQDGHKSVWEIKPSNQTALPKNQDKFYAAELACVARGWKFEVIVENRINQLAETVKRQHLD